MIRVMLVPVVQVVIVPAKWTFRPTSKNPELGATAKITNPAKIMPPEPQFGDQPSPQAKHNHSQPVENII